MRPTSPTSSTVSRITDAFIGRNGVSWLGALQTFATGLLPGDKSVVFIDNHDNQRGDNLYYASSSAACRSTSWRPFSCSRIRTGTPSVMSSYGFDRATQAGRDAGPPSAPGGVTQSTYDAGGTRCTRTIGSAQLGSWICEHRLGAIAGMVAFRKATVGAPLVGFRTIDADNNRIAFARDGKGFVALSRSLAVRFTAATTLPDGNYCNIAQFTYQPAGGGAGRQLLRPACRRGRRQCVDQSARLRGGGAARRCETLIHDDGPFSLTPCKENLHAKTPDPRCRSRGARCRSRCATGPRPGDARSRESARRHGRDPLPPPRRQL